MPLSREQRSGGAEEQRSRGAEERRKKNTIFLNPWVFPYIGSFLASGFHLRLEELVCKENKSTMRSLPSGFHPRLEELVCKGKPYFLI
ncbi:MAG: hypothetical protein F6K41_40965, partial [Symploca sp. SIO3E6]|nr:hypothetical protein [Caldora sp. SIO3E6]